MEKQLDVKVREDALENYFVKHYLLLSKLLSFSGLVFPTLAAVGWFLDIEILKRGHSALPAMQPNTVIGLLLSATSVFFSYEGAPKSTRVLNISVALVIMSLGFITLSEYLSGMDFGIDRIFVDTVPSDAQPFPGRPSPQASLNFIFFGISILIYNLPFPFIRVGQMCALIVNANSIVSFTGFIFSTEEFYGFPVYKPAIGMAAPTAVTFLMLGVGLLCRRPREGMMSLVTSETKSGGIARSILFAGIFVPPLVGAITHIGVSAGLFDEGAQISLFTVVIVGIILRTTWKSARYAEKIELKEKAALTEIQIANENLNKALDERQIFFALVENSSDFIGIADPSGKPIYVNPAGRRIVGLPDDVSIETTKIQDYYTPEQRSFANDVILKSMIEKGYWKGETFFRHWKTEAAVPVSDEHFMIRESITGRVLGMGTVTRDISDMMEAKNKLRQSEEQLDLALRGADLGLWDWNIKTGKVEFNTRWAEMRGYHLNEVKPYVDSWISGIHPEDLPRVQKTLDDYFNGRISEYESEFRVSTKSGNWIWILDRGKLFERDSEGRPARMVGTELDITERKRLEEAVRLNEAKASGIVSISADAIVSIDEDQKITLFNEGAEQIFGYSNSEMIGRPIEILMPERFRIGHRHLVEEFAKEKGMSRRKGEKGKSITGLRKNGEEFPAEASISKLEIGGVKIFTAALRDISDQQNREIQLQRAIKTREDVLAIVSHDLKNPVSVIGLSAQMLKRMDEVDTNKIQRIADKIQLSTSQMSQLIGDLLDFSKIESGTFAVEIYAESLNDFLSPIFEGVRTLTESRMQNFDVSLASDLPEVACDADRICQVMSNLLGNAIKFTPEGGIIRVSAIQKNDSIVVTVSDTGPGIPSDQISKIFDRFWQPKETQKQGSGLGLSIAKGIVEAHGGKIWADSIPGKGANFHFTIPIATSETQRQESTGVSQSTVGGKISDMQV